MMKPDGFDKAIVGLEPNSQRFVYDRQKMISIAVYEMDMSHEDAIEYLKHMEHADLGKLREVTNER